jgi:hypothetical protein
MFNYVQALKRLLAIIYIVTIGISALSGLIGFRLRRPLHLNVFAVLLVFTFGVESYSVNHNNVWLYNIFILLEFLTYAWFLSRIIESKKVKKSIRIFFIFFPAFWLFVTLFDFNNKVFNNPCITVGSVFIVFLGACYYYQILLAEKAINLARNPEFWITSGLLMFYCCTLPVFGLFNYLFFYEGSVRAYVAIQLIPVLQTLAISLYVLLTYAFVCSLPTRNSL